MHPTRLAVADFYDLSEEKIFPFFSWMFEVKRVGFHKRFGLHALNKLISKMRVFSMEIEFSSFER